MDKKYSIRQATLADIGIIQELALKTWEPTYQPILTKEQIDYMFDRIYTKKALEQQMQDGQTFFILSKAEQPIGFAAFSLKEQKQQVFKLNKIYLLPGCHGKGLGKKLLTALEKEAKQRGATILDLNVNRHNKAKDFYEACGYHVHLQEDIPIGPYWMNDYVMRKKL